MRPATCGVCGISAIQSSNGDWVTFSGYKQLASEEIGHPAGLEWFCEIHLDEARLLSGLNSSEALAELRKRYPIAGNTNIKKQKNHWGQRLTNRKTG